MRGCYVFYETQKLYDIINCVNDRITLQTGAAPSKEEIAVANFLVLQNKKTTVRFLAVPNKKYERTPDIEMDGKKWEIKCPRGAGKYLMQNIIHKALHQSPNIIIDIRNTKMYKSRAMSGIKKIFALSKSVKTIIIITKSQKCIVLSK